MRQSSLPRADLKPHITTRGVLVGYMPSPKKLWECSDPADLIAACSESAALLLIQTLVRLGKEPSKIEHIHFRGADKSDPLAQRGYWAAKFA